MKIRKNASWRDRHRTAKPLCLALASAFVLFSPSFVRTVTGVAQDAGVGQNVELVGHHDNTWDQTQRFNPFTNQQEWNGTSILDVSDPTNPELVWHIPNAASANSRSTSVVYDYRLDSNPPGRDHQIRNSQGEGFAKFEIFDITSRDTDPSQIRLVTELLGTPEDSCGAGCGGPFTATHKGWWSPETGLYYAAANEPGFRTGHHLVIWDLRDPANPDFVGRGWLPGQRTSEPETSNSLNWHHPIVDEENDRVYGAYLGGGDVVSFDIEDPSNPKLVWRIETPEPPGRGTHTVAPVLYDDLPNFGPEALPRWFALVADEATGPDIACTHPVRTKVYMLDISHADETGAAFPVDTWQVPDGNFCEKGAASARISSRRPSMARAQPLRGQDRLRPLLQCRSESARHLESL